MGDSIESIRLENIIIATFLRHQSKISFRILDDDWYKYIYFNKVDQSLELFNDEDKLYYFDIEFDSEINELLETTQFKIRVSE